MVALLREHVFWDEKLPVGSDYPTLRKRESDKDSNDVPESLFSQMEFMLQDRMIRHGPH